MMSILNHFKIAQINDKNVGNTYKPKQIFTHFTVDHLLFMNDIVLKEYTRTFILQK